MMGFKSRASSNGHLDVINGTFASQQIPDTTTFVPTALTNESYTNVTGGQRVGVVRRDNGVTVFSGAGMNTTVAQADIQVGL